MGESKNVMPRELAESEFAKWAEIHDIDGEENGKGKELLIKALENGSLVLEDGDFVYTISTRSPENCAGEKLRLVEPNVRAYMAMDGYKDTDSIHKAMAMASAVCAKPMRWFSDLAGSDWKIISVVLSFLL